MGDQIGKEYGNEMLLGVLLDVHNGFQIEAYVITNLILRSHVGPGFALRSSICVLGPAYSGLGVMM